MGRSRLTAALAATILIASGPARAIPVEVIPHISEPIVEPHISEPIEEPTPAYHASEEEDAPSSRSIDEDDDTSSHPVYTHPYYSDGDAGGSVVDNSTDADANDSDATDDNSVADLENVAAPDASNPDPEVRADGWQEFLKVLVIAFSLFVGAVVIVTVMRVFRRK